MKHQKKFFIAVVVLGVALLVSGFIVEALLGESRFLGFATGFGSAIIAVAVVNLARNKRDPQLVKEQEINEKDERHIQIRGRAAQNTFYVSLFGMVAVVIAFVFLDYMVPCFIMIGLMFLHAISYFAFLGHYDKKM